MRNVVFIGSILALSGIAFFADRNAIAGFVCVSAGTLILVIFVIAVILAEQECDECGEEERSKEK